MRQRTKELLTAAAGAFAETRSPFENAWLVEHEVTLDECVNLSDEIARAIRIYVNAPDDVRLRNSFRDTMVESGVHAEVVEHAMDGLRMKQIVSKLKRDGAKGGG